MGRVLHPPLIRAGGAAAAPTGELVLLAGRPPHPGWCLSAAALELSGPEGILVKRKQAKSGSRNPGHVTKISGIGSEQPQKMGKKAEKKAEDMEEDESSDSDSSGSELGTRQCTLENR